MLQSTRFILLEQIFNLGDEIIFTLFVTSKKLFFLKNIIIYMYTYSVLIKDING